MAKKIAQLTKPLINRIVGHGDERVDQLLANPLNFRLHPDNQQQALAGAMDDIGFIRSVTVNQRTGRVVDGHLRVTIAARSNVESLPVEYVDLDEAEEAQALLSLDPIAAMAATDKAKLDELMRSVQSDDERVQTMLAEMAEREGLEYGKQEPTGEVPEPEIDKAAELQAKWETAPGQVWQLGEHLIACSDNTDPDLPRKLLGDVIADLLLTDPPYGDLVIMDKEKKVGRDNAAKCKSYGNHYQGEGNFDFAPTLSNWNGKYKKSVIWGGNYFTHLLPVRTSWLVWDKRAGEHSWFSDVELAWSDLGIPARLFAFTWQGMIRAGDKAERMHPTQKPVELMEWVLRDLAPDAQIVLELFSGSGTTLIACERLGRKCRAVEISPAYVAVALQRWSDMTGKQPQLIG